MLTCRLATLGFPAGALPLLLTVLLAAVAPAVVAADKAPGVGPLTWTSPPSFQVGATALNVWCLEGGEPPAATSFQVGFATAGLAAGMYVANLRIRPVHAGTATAVHFPVWLTVQRNVALSLEGSWILSFGNRDPRSLAPHAVSVRNTGTTAVPFVVRKTMPWVSCTPGSKILEPGQACELTVACDQAGLSLGEYMAGIFISDELSQSQGALRVYLSLVGWPYSMPVIGNGPVTLTPFGDDSVSSLGSWVSGSSSPTAHRSTRT